MASSQELVVYDGMPHRCGDVFAPHGSPFVTKLLAYLCLSKTPFKVAPGSTQNFGKAPKGKMPFVELPSGEKMGDSQFIIEHLEARKHEGARFDNHLSAEQRAVSHVVRRTCEDSLYWNTAIEKRWRRKDNYYEVTVPWYFQGLLPKCLGCLLPVIASFIRKQVLQSYTGQGMGRHTEADAARLGMQDILAVEALCSGKAAGPYFHGDKPSTVDAVVYAFVTMIKVNMHKYPFEDESAEAALERQCPKLNNHWSNMDKQLTLVSE
eukprot:TRINITY_DN120804_c0_g1_i1.p1 TRINITY_DN120804_c0_g1~~TRINITY_DN120804_c0_g1_i1.p1  ORF type:complete len:265 (-),score=39.35 TRINITY_DN120804_c0_g1_i1:212-1006(-)